MELIVSSHKIRGEWRLHGSYDVFAGKLCASLTDDHLISHRPDSVSQFDFVALVSCVYSVFSLSNMDVSLAQACKKNTVPPSHPCTHRWTGGIPDMDEYFTSS